LEPVLKFTHQSFYNLPKQTDFDSSKFSPVTPKIRLGKFYLQEMTLNFNCTFPSTDGLISALLG